MTMFEIIALLGVITFIIFGANVLRAAESEQSRLWVIPAAVCSAFLV